jgi:hypothetical protein
MGIPTPQSFRVMGKEISPKQKPEGQCLRLLFQNPSERETGKNQLHPLNFLKTKEPIFIPKVQI